MKILDRYLIKQFIQTILFAIIAFTLLFVIIDMMENLDDFIDQEVPNSLIFQYYFVFIPEIIRLILPVSVLLGAMFTVGKMSTQNEFTAIKSSGVSLYRFMVPFLISSMFIGLFAVFFGGYIVPMANKHKVHIEQKYMKKGVIYAGANIFFQDSKNRIVTINYFDAIRQLANRISIQEFDSTDVTKLVRRYDSIEMRYDDSTKTWIMRHGVKRVFDGIRQTSEPFDTLRLMDMNFTPAEVVTKQQKPEEMSLDELEVFAEEQLRSGIDPTRIRIEYHSRIAFAFACFIVVLFGLPLSANKRRGGLAIQFGINILITFIYLVFMRLSQAFGKNGVLHPVLTAWFANIIFLIGAIINIIRVKK